MSADIPRRPGTFRWQDDPNYQGPKPAPAPNPAPIAVPTEKGPAIADYALLAKTNSDGRQGNRGQWQGKGSAFLTDAIGTVAGAIDTDVGNEIQSRAAGMRMRGDKAQAQAALDEYTQAFNATDDAAMRQQYASTAANIAKGADLKVPAAVENGATFAGTLAEGAAKSVPLLGGLALSQLKDGGQVGMTAEDERAAYAKAFDEICSAAAEATPTGTGQATAIRRARRSQAKDGGRRS